MTTIDIIAIFCDKDSQHIDTFLSYVKRLSFNFKLTVLDNRHDKSEDLSSKFIGYNYVILDEDVGLFETRRKGFKLTNNDWVWFVDIDDELFDFKFDYNKDDDIILYNFKLNYNNKILSNYGQSRSNRLYKINGTDKEIGFIDEFFSCNGVWNKIFNRKTLEKTYEKIPEMKDLFLYEDIFLMKHFIFIAKRYRTDTQNIYQYNAKNIYPFGEHIDYIKNLIQSITDERIKKFLENKIKTNSISWQ